MVLVHPFRDGNGRISRLLAILMALQAGLPILNFEHIEGKGRNTYFMAEYIIQMLCKIENNRYYTGNNI